MENKLITVEQIPIITEKLHEVAKDIEGKVTYAKNLICTEQNKQSIKTIRTNLKKDFEEYESQRKAVKEKIMAPYMQFESVYKECISDKFKAADKDLKDKIDAIEVEQKNRIEQESREFLEQCKKDSNVDFVTFEQLNIKIGLSDTLTKIKKQIQSTIDKIVDDLKLIDIQENKTEVLVEYKRSLNVSEAITTVVARKKEIEIENQKTDEQKITQKIGKVIPETPTNEKIFTITFKVTGTAIKLKQLKDYLIREGYQYE